MMLRRLMPVGLLVAALAVAPACQSPTLPLPPPEDPTVQAVDADHVLLSAPCGGAEPTATIVVINTNPAVPSDKAVGGAIADSCGRWDSTVWAHNNDLLTVSQQYGSDVSNTTNVIVHVP